MPHLTISLLGSFQVVLDGNVISGFTSKKARALLAYLAVEASYPHQREALAGLLWPDYPQASARANLRNVLANLRQVIGDRSAAPPFLAITPQTIQFNPVSDYSLDVATFTELLTKAISSPSNLDTLQEAVVLYQGVFLAGFSLPDSVLFEEWVRLQREALSRQMVTALNRLVDHCQQRNDFEQALTYAWQQLDVEPWQEEAHRQVMRLLARDGQRSKALAQYETCRKMLAEELAVEPATETITLYEQIRDGVWPSQADVEKFSSHPGHNLPVQLLPLLGRETELTNLETFLTDPEYRLVTIVGLAGIGKTRLSLETAQRQLDHFDQGVYLVSLAPLQTTDEIIPAIAQAISFTFYDQATPKQQLLDYLRQKQMLLIMDNFEHLLDGAGLLLELLNAAPKLKLLVTSRVSLRLQGGQLFPLTGLAYPAQDNSDFTQGTHYGAVALFLQSARRVRPAFRLNADNQPAVVQICRLVQGLPLALLLAAHWIRLLSPSEIAEEIRRGLDFLTADVDDLPPRQRSLQVTFEHTWQLLGKTEQVVFQQLSVFQGGFKYDAAQDVAQATLPILLSLASKFLLHRTSGGRYEFHEMLRQFAAQKLNQSPATAEEVRDRHSAFYATFLQQREADLKGARQKEALAEMQAEAENIRVAWYWAIERRHLEYLDIAVNGLSYFYEWRNRYQDGEAACRAAAEMLVAHQSSETLRISAKIFLWQGIFNRLLGRSEQASQLIQHSLSLLDHPVLADQDIRAEKAAILLELGGKPMTNLVKAKQWCEQSLSLYRSLNDQWGTARALNWLGHHSNFTGHYEQGRDFTEASLKLHQGLGNRREAAAVLDNLGFWAILHGQVEQGEKILRQSLAIYRDIDDKAIISDCLVRLATGLVMNGQFHQAYDLAKERLMISQELGHRPMIAAAYGTWGMTHWTLGRYVQARELGEKSLHLFQEIADPYGLSFMLWILGDVALAQENYTKAKEMLQESVAIHQAMGEWSRQYDVLISLGHAELSLGSVASAQEHLIRALRVGLEDHLFFTRIRAIALAALLFVKQGKSEQGVELYALATRFPYIATLSWHAEQIAPDIARTAALPPEVAAGVQVRGRARDLETTIEELLIVLQTE